METEKVLTPDSAEKYLHKDGYFWHTKNMELV